MNKEKSLTYVKQKIKHYLMRDTDFDMDMAAKKLKSILLAMEKRGRIADLNVSERNSKSGWIYRISDNEEPRVNAKGLQVDQRFRQDGRLAINILISMQEKSQDYIDTKKALIDKCNPERISNVDKKEKREILITVGDWDDLEKAVNLIKRLAIDVSQDLYPEFHETQRGSALETFNAAMSALKNNVPRMTKKASVAHVDYSISNLSETVRDFAQFLVRQSYKKDGSIKIIFSFENINMPDIKKKAATIENDIESGLQPKKSRSRIEFSVATETDMKEVTHYLDGTFKDVDDYLNGRDEEEHLPPEPR